jgi:uncharacterized protein YeaC (DUF1315 family)
MVHFQVKPFYSIEIGSEPNGIAISELNNDSCFDIVIVNSWYNSTGIFLEYDIGTSFQRNIFFILKQLRSPFVIPTTTID